MLVPEFEEFRKALSPYLPKEVLQQEIFKKLLGQQIKSLIVSPKEQSEFVSKSLELTGVSPARNVVDDDYGIGLIKNYTTKGTGSFSVAVALYYLLLKLQDTPERPYSYSVKILNLHLFSHESFEEKFSWTPEKIAPLGHENLSMSWALFLEKHATFSQIEVELERSKKRRMSITGFKSLQPVFKQKIPLDRGFRFRVRIPLSGTGLALQSCGNIIHPLLFSRNQMLFTCDGSAFFFPLETDNKLDKYLYEETETEIRQYTFVLTSSGSLSESKLIQFSSHLKLGSEVPTYQLDQFAKDLTSTHGQVIVRRINIDFIPQSSIDC